MEKKVLSCEFNMDTGCVEVKYADGRPPFQILIIQITEG